MSAVPTVFFYDQTSPVVDYSQEVLAGLKASAKYILPKFFYDERGSELFTEITHQPEYYLNEAETRLLRQHAAEINSLIGDEILLIEYGSGSSTKVRILLENLRPAIYAPLDISRDYLADTAEAIAREYPWLEVHATCVDFTAEFELPFRSDKRRISFFLGSSIGNLEPQEAGEFLRRVRRLVGDDGAVVLGVDLKKDIEILNAAYNDAAGVTRLFNLNILQHLNGVYGANFELEKFEHQAHYNSEKGCIQMFLNSKVDQTVEVGVESVAFKAGEQIHTENSYKYTITEIEVMTKAAGFNGARIWTDEAALFGIFFLTA